MDSSGIGRASPPNVKHEAGEFGLSVLEAHGRANNGVRTLEDAGRTNELDFGRGGVRTTEGNLDELPERLEECVERA